MFAIVDGRRQRQGMVLRLLSLSLLLIWALLGGSSAQAQGSRRHRVRAGETLSGIARRYGTTVSRLRRANPRRSSRLSIGQRLRIPSLTGPPAARRVRVQPGDSLALLARRYHSSIAAIRRANRLSSDGIRAGQRLWIPRRGASGADIREAVHGSSAQPGQSASVPAEVREQARSRARALGIGSTASAHRLLREAAPAQWIEAAGHRSDLEGTLALPLSEGRYLRGWGSGAGGYHLAVDIGARSGTPVHAAEAGLVVYAGRGLRGYGNIVLLLHANGWVTAYAHHRRNRVVAGQLVTRGELIGEVGSTGYARGPHLHFMFVFEDQHCDPLPLMRPRLTRASGEEVDEPTLTWDSTHRPSGIRCLPRSARPHPRYDSSGRRRRGRRRQGRRRRER